MMIEFSGCDCRFLKRFGVVGSIYCMDRLSLQWNRFNRVGSPGFINFVFLSYHTHHEIHPSWLPL